jgi:hypothetical protein
MQSVSKVVDTLTWKLRGALESDATRPFIFGFRDLWQREEVTRRTEWAREIAARHAGPMIDRRIGFAHAPIADLDVTPISTLGQAVAAAARASGKLTNPNGFYINRMLPEDQQPTMLALALDERLMQLVTAYLGVVPVLVDMDFFCSLPVADRKPYTGSQLYHCDDTSMTLVKVFVYCDEVTTERGPLQAIHASRSKSLRKMVRYRYGGSAYRVSDEAMSALVRDDEVHAFLGPPGTWFAIDTARCFHRGSRIRGSDQHRTVAYLEYAPPNTTRLQLRLRRGTPYAHLAGKTSSALAKAVLGEPVA